MPKITVVRARKNHMRGQQVAGQDDRVYQVSKATGKLHFLNGGMPIEEARVHPDDIAEFADLPLDFEVTTEEAVRHAPPPPPAAKKGPPAKGGKGSPAAKTAGSSDQLGAGSSTPPASKPNTKRADEKALPPEAAGWSSHRLLTEASMRGIKITPKEREMGSHELHALIAAKVGVADPDAETENDEGGEE